MMIKYTIHPVRKYTGTTPSFEAGVELDTNADIVSVSSSIEYSVDVFQSSSAINRIGRLSLNLHNNFGQFSAGNYVFANSSRDHRLVVSRAVNGVDKIIWSGFVKEIIETGRTAEVSVHFDHDLNRLDDIMIAGDEARPLVSFDTLLAEVNAQLPTYLQFTKRGGLNTAMVHRPENNTSARSFFGQVLSAERLIGFYSNVSDGWVIASADALDESTYYLHIDHADIQDLRIEDDKSKMYNVMEYTPYYAPDHDGESSEIVYEGDDELYRPPASFIHQYGRRELRLAFDHLDPDVAAEKAEGWQDAVIKPRARCEVLIDIPNHAETIGINHLVYLEADDRNGVLRTYTGWFRVVGMAINPTDQNVRLSLVGIVDVDQAVLDALIMRSVS